MQDEKVKSAYAQCLKLAQEHYENFPTASRIIDKRHRNATAAIYSFARRADDIADEGDLSAEERIQQLDQFSNMLGEIYNGDMVVDPTFIALSDTINRYNLPVIPFEKLLTAFRMDVHLKQFSNNDEILNYCEYSANPVGELILRIHDRHSPETQILSDRICTALQLINFLQDIHEDYAQRNRIYLPADEMRKFGLTENHIKNMSHNRELFELVNAQLVRAVDMLISGAALVDHLRGRLKWLIKLTIVSALLVSEKLSMRENVFVRPSLSSHDWLTLAIRTISFRPDRTHAKILDNIKHRKPVE